MTINSGTATPGPLYVENDFIARAIWDGLRDMILAEERSSAPRTLYAIYEAEWIDHFVMARVVIEPTEDGDRPGRADCIEVADKGKWVVWKDARNDQLMRIWQNAVWQPLHPLELLAYRIG